jgi:c-di-GMP-binding flagellar brake protein YcgR
MDVDSIENLQRKKTFSIFNGTRLSIEIEGIFFKLNSFVVGFVINEYLVISMPKFDNLSLLKTKLFKGNKVVVRYLEEGTVFGFESEIMGYLIEPKKLILISYPKLVARHDLRNNKRYDCYILGELSLSDGTKYSAMIMDLSEKGFRVAVKAADNLSMPKINISDQIVFHFRLSESSEILNITGEVKNMQNDGKRIIVGIMSTDVGDEFKKITNSYIAFLDDEANTGDGPG